MFTNAGGGGASRPLPGPSDADRAGEFSFGRLELGGPTSSRFSAMAASSRSVAHVDKIRGLSCDGRVAPPPRLSTFSKLATRSR